MRSLRILPLVLLLACSTAPAPADPPASTPTPAPVDSRGKITQYHRSIYGEPPVGTILVEGPAGEDVRYPRAKIRVTRETQIVRAGEDKRIPFNRLGVGSLVEVTFTGPVEKSEPVQAEAARIVLLGSEPVEQ